MLRIFGLQGSKDSFLLERVVVKGEFFGFVLRHLFFISNLLQSREETRDATQKLPKLR